jgi:hypothetical protein
MTSTQPTRSSIRITLFLLSILALFPALSSAQQTYVGRYDLYAGFSDLNTPGLNSLNQVGFHFQAGVNMNRWLAGGFDYSVQTGNTSLTANLATPELQEELAAELPPGYVLDIPLHAVTQTFTAGTQLVYRRFSRTTLFIRPSLSAFRITATPHPTDPIGQLVAEQLAPQGHLTDWTGAYGAGGGMEYNLAKHFGVRAQLDAVWNHPFNSVLGSGHWTYRYSVGPAFHFGHNVPSHSAK